MEIVFGTDLVHIFMDTPYGDLIAAERMQMSKEGFLLPIVRLRDEMMIGSKEYIVVIYHRVVYREQAEVIDGIIPEKISYCLLQEVLKRFLDRGNYPLYLPRVIESLESALYKDPNASAEALAEQV